MRLKIAVPMILLLLLCACGVGDSSAQTPIVFRTSLNESLQSGFQLDVTADYGDYTRNYILDCICMDGKCDMTVVQPEVVSGIHASVSGEDGEVSYEDTVLAVPQLSSRKISPLVAPYLMDQAWRKGYIVTTSLDGEYEVTEYVLSYGSGEISVTTWFLGGIPLRAEIRDQGYAILTCYISEVWMNERD